MILTLIEISWVKKNSCVVYPLKGWKRCRSQQRADNPVLTCQRILYKSCFTKEEEKNRCKLAQWRAPLLLFHPQKIWSFLRAAKPVSGVCGKQGRESHRAAAAPLAVVYVLRSTSARVNQLVLETQGEQTEWQFEHHQKTPKWKFSETKMWCLLNGTWSPFSLCFWP